MVAIPSFETRLLDMKNRFERNLPGRVADIVETLRQREDSGGGEYELPRQLHNLAGTAGSFGFHTIAAVANEGYEECVELDGRPLRDSLYLWSILEELTYAASGDFIQGSGLLSATRGGEQS